MRGLEPSWGVTEEWDAKSKSTYIWAHDYRMVTGYHRQLAIESGARVSGRNRADIEPVRRRLSKKCSAYYDRIARTRRRKGLEP